MATPSSVKDVPSSSSSKRTPRLDERSLVAAANWIQEVSHSHSNSSSPYRSPPSTSASASSPPAEQQAQAQAEATHYSYIAQSILYLMTSYANGNFNRNGGVVDANAPLGYGYGSSSNPSSPYQYQQNPYQLPTMHPYQLYQQPYQHTYQHLPQPNPNQHPLSPTPSLAREGGGGGAMHAGLGVRNRHGNGHREPDGNRDMNEDRGAGVHVDVAQRLLDLRNVLRRAGVAPAAANPPDAAAIAAAQGGIAPLWLHVRVLFRIYVVYFLFAQDASPVQQVLLGAIGTIYYLLETGLLYSVAKVVFRLLGIHVAVVWGVRRGNIGVDARGVGLGEVGGELVLREGDLDRILQALQQQQQPDGAARVRGAEGIDERGAGAERRAGTRARGDGTLRERLQALNEALHPGEPTPAPLIPIPTPPPTPPPPPPREPVTLSERLVAHIQYMHREGYPVPQAPGHILDTMSVIYAFFASLWPMWDPRPVTPIPLPVHVPAPVPIPVPVPEQDAGMADVEQLRQRAVAVAEEEEAENQREGQGERQRDGEDNAPEAAL